MIFTVGRGVHGRQLRPAAVPAAIVNDLGQFYASVEKIRGIAERDRRHRRLRPRPRADRSSCAPRRTGATADERAARSSARPSALTEETIFTWGAPPLKFGAGALDEIGFELAQYGAKRVLIVTDPSISAHRHPAPDRRPADAGTASTSEIFDGVHVEPTDDSMRQGGRLRPRAGTVGRLRRRRRRLVDRHRQGGQPAHHRRRRADGLPQRADRTAAAPRGASSSR